MEAGEEEPPPQQPVDHQQMEQPIGDTEDKGREEKEKWEDLSGDGGVLKLLQKRGQGAATPGLGNKVFINYQIFLQDSAQLVDTQDQLEVTLDKGNLIPALEMALLSMKSQEKVELQVSPQYGYGSTGCPPFIPPNSHLRIEVTLMDWRPEDLSPEKNGGILVRYIRRGEGKATPGLLTTCSLNVVGHHEGRVFDRRFEVLHELHTGANNLPHGLDLVVETMRKNAKVHVALKSKFGFGDQGSKDLGIPPGADLEYEVELQNFERDREIWEMTSADCLVQAELLRKKGSQQFKDGRAELAKKMFRRVVELVEQEEHLPAPQAQSRKQVLSVAHLNLSLCALRDRDYLEARRHADSALRYDPASIKGHYRKGQAHLEMGDFEEAKAAFQKVVELEPSNKAAQNQIRIAVQKAKQQASHDRAVYRGMFAKFANQDLERGKYSFTNLPEPDYWDPNDLEKAEMEENLGLGAALLEEGFPNLDRSSA